MGGECAKARKETDADGLEARTTHPSINMIKGARTDLEALVIALVL